MKIAFLVGPFPALPETFILNQITSLIERGHTVDIYPKSPGDTSKMHPEVATYKLLDRTYYQPKMPQSRSFRVVKGFGLLCINVWKAPMALLRSLNIFKYGKQAYSLRLFYAAIPFLPTRSYDIVHCHFGTCGNLGVMLRDIGLVSGKVVTAFHGFDLSRQTRSEGRDVYSFLFEMGDLFLPVSETWKRELIKLGCCKDKITVHRMGIDTSKFRMSRRKPRTSGKLRLLTVARLVEKKGVEYGIRAVAKLARKCPEVEYRIVGDGPLRKEIEVLIDQLDVNDRVKLLGWKHQDEVIGEMRKADLLLAPSVESKDGDREGIPVVLMEAMAQGLPVISTWHSGIPELVLDGVSGMLAPERDINALAQKIRYLSDYPEAWSQMGKAGRAYVEEHYDVNKLTDRLVEIYRHLLRSSSSSTQKTQTAKECDVSTQDDSLLPYSAG